MSSKLPDPRWVSPEGEVISCTEKLKVLRENLEEIRQVTQDAFEDALLMGCDEKQVREVFVQLIAGLDNPYPSDKD
ncbi:MAG TPA: hypothetical protein VJU83_04720 [Burkholderiales bacterium]|nr:hypothetical protein [Burkholderiales bacterium]